MNPLLELPKKPLKQKSVVRKKISLKFHRKVLGQYDGWTDRNIDFIKVQTSLRELYPGRPIRHEKQKNIFKTAAKFLKNSSKFKWIMSVIFSLVKNSAKQIKVRKWKENFYVQITFPSKKANIQRKALKTIKVELIKKTREMKILFWGRRRNVFNCLYNCQANPYLWITMIQDFRLIFDRVVCEGGSSFSIRAAIPVKKQ